MKEAFIEKRFSPSRLRTINTVNDILDEYAQQGFRLTLRQLYYQLVSRAMIENTVRSYKNLGNLVSDARQAGMIDWKMIEDRNRSTVCPAHWESPAEIARAAAQQFRVDKWADQPYHVEVMVEKDALSGVLEPTCRTLDVGLTANKGYSSSSTMYEIGKRLAGHWAGSQWAAAKNIVVFYLGDHDPSGIDMTRDVEERLRMYSGVATRSLQVERLALNFDQVEQWGPPENPAKETDSRFEAYAEEYGESSWELDAVEPRTLADLVEEAVYKYRDEDLWDAAVEREDKMRKDLLTWAENYGKDGEQG